MSTDFYHFILPQILCDDWRKCKRKAALNDSLHILFFFRVQCFYMFTVFKCKICTYFLFSLSFLFFNPCLESLSSQCGETELKFLHQSPLSQQYILLSSPPHPGNHLLLVFVQCSPSVNLHKIQGWDCLKDSFKYL